MRPSGAFGQHWPRLKFGKFQPRLDLGRPSLKYSKSGTLLQSVHRSSLAPSHYLCQLLLSPCSLCLSFTLRLPPMPPSSCLSSLKLPSTIFMHSSMTSVPTLQLLKTTPSCFMISFALAQRRLHISSLLL